MGSKAPPSRSWLPLPIYFDHRQIAQNKIPNHFLGDRLAYSPAFLDNTVIFSVDTEWYENEPQEITELSFSVIDSAAIVFGTGPWGALHAMKTYYAMAREAGIASAYGGGLIKLKDLIANFGIHKDYLHTAGNDSAYKTIAAFFAAASTTATAAGSSMSNPSSTANHQAEVNRLKNDSGPRSYLTMGAPTYCTRCKSTDHMVDQCNAKVLCDKCASDPKHHHLADTHQTRKCIVTETTQSFQTPKKRLVAVPCGPCSVHPDSKRWKRADMHTTEECFFGKDKGA